MDGPPSRTLDSPRQSRRRGTTPSISENPHSSQPAPVSGSTNTSLPSIRHLHPHLPPPNQYFGLPDPSAYPPSFEHPQSGSARYQTQPAHQDLTKELSTIEESDSDKHSSPPPKKRRKRQALSCTECKRRKIKCDRTQPCGPCARRGESDKCQWHQVETNDKYVTRTEYDQLKARVDHLESIIVRLTGAGNAHLQPTMVPAPTMPTGAGPSHPPYAHHGRSTSGSYNLAPEYAPDPYSASTRPSVTALPSSSRTTLSGEINPPAPEREIPPSRQYAPPHRPASRQFRAMLGPVTAAQSYGSADGPDERPKKRFAWTLQGVRPRQSCRAVDQVQRSQPYSTLLLPFLSLLVFILHFLTLRPPPLVPPQSSRWKPLLKAHPSTDHPLPEDYGIIGRTATQSPLWSFPPNAPGTAGWSYNPLLPPVESDPCQTHKARQSYFLGLGSINRLGALG